MLLGQTRPKSSPLICWVIGVVNVMIGYDL